jgi:hypothetical protein
MERTLRFLACTAIAGTLSGAGLYAQVVTYSASGPGQPGPGPVITGRMMSITGGDMERSVKNAPFSAQAVTTTTQVLGDGNRIVQTSETTLARDSEGRTRREISVDKLGPWSTDTTGRVVIIRDPVAQTGYEIAPDGQHARKTGGWMGDAQRLFKVQKEVETATVRARTDSRGVTQTIDIHGGEPMGWSVVVSDMEEGGTKKEQLGEQTIEGVRAQGTRETRTIAAGRIGNERPIEIVSETWYSPDLQMVVQSRHSDPRAGETVYRLTNVVLTEPDASLFQLPPGVTVTTEDQDNVMHMKKLHDEHERDQPERDQPEPPPPPQPQQ